jgi:drug/metabolite transporter (DMT)-like permease
LPDVNDTSSHRLGLILTGMAALSWSSAGVFTRLISADLMTMLFWRGLFSGTAIFLVFLFLERGKACREFLRMGWPGLFVALLSATGMVTGIGSIRYGSVADAMVIYATVPFVTAGVAFLLIGERTSRSTIIASLVALAGVVIMLLGSDWGGSMLGKGLAVLMTLSMAGFSVIMRGHRDLPMLPAMALSAWLCSAFCFSWASPAEISATDLMLCAAFGTVQNAAGLVFYTFGTKRIPAAEATLLAALEVPFTPFWVWLFLNETPAIMTLIGGGVVLVALFTHIFGEFRRGGKATEAEFAPTP